MAIHIHSYISHIRIYEDRVDVDMPLCKMREPYNGTITLLIDEFGTAHASLANIVNLSIKDFKAVLNYCKQQNVIKFTYKHKDKVKEILLRDI